MNLWSRLQGPTDGAVTSDGATGMAQIDLWGGGRLEHQKGCHDATCQLHDLRIIYEPFLASRALPDAGLCLDIGAGAGWFGLSFAQLFKEWTVICVEADPVQFGYLAANAERLELNNVICVNAAFHPDCPAPGKDDAVALLEGKARTNSAAFMRLLALPSKYAPISGKDRADAVSAPGLSPHLIAGLAPALIRLDAPGCEEAIAQSLKHNAVGMIVGRIYPYLPSGAFLPSQEAGARQFYLVHGEHVLRRDYEDNFVTRRSGLDVVVAMYNTLGLVQECVDSILADGNPDVSVIVVDDGSTDGCGELIEELYRGHPRVKLLRKANGGCASARNYGRQHSDATHIAFVDADDRVDSGMFTALLETARYTGAFVVEGEFKTFTTQADGTELVKPSYEANLYKQSGLHRLGDLNYDWIPSHQIIAGQPTIWRRIHRRDFLDRKNIWFPEHVRAFDDQIFQVLVGEYAGEIAHVHGLHYHYRQHPAQDIQQGDERHFYSFNMFRKIYQRALDEGWKNVDPINRSLINTMRWSYRGLREDLRPIYVEGATEFLAIINKVYGLIISPHDIQRAGIAGLDYLVERRMMEMKDVPVSYAMMRMENWRWQPEFIRMMRNI